MTETGVKMDQLLEAIRMDDVLQVKQIIGSEAFRINNTSSVLTEVLNEKKPNSRLILKLLVDKTAPLEGLCLKALERAVALRDIESIFVLMDFRVDLKDFFDIKEVFIFTDSLKQNIFILNVLILLFENINYGKSLTDYRAFVYVIIFNFLGQVRNSKILKNYMNPAVEFLVHLEQIELLSSPKNLIFRNVLSTMLELSLGNITTSELEDLIEDCFKASEAQVLKMKEYKVSCKHTFWNFIKEPIEKIIPLIRNKELIKNVDEFKFSNEDSIYKDILQIKLDEAFKRKLLIDQSIEALSKCLPHVGKNFEILEKIFHYLDFPDLLLCQ